MFTDEDKVFIRAILTNPAELTAWLVYADWLDEHDDPRAEYIRLEVRRTAHDTTQSERFGIIARMEELRLVLDPDWLAVFDRPRVENCDDQFAFKCPKQWENLRATDEPTVRHCEACQKDVYYCNTTREAYDHAQKGDCVAIASLLPHAPDVLERDPDAPRSVLMMGMMLPPDPEHDPSPTRRRWWQRLKFW
jgi:uncharacterized protein (TIGR02996 family)